ncbi:MAG: polyamine ABC transporter substrate-binding protein [Actinomycetota bacterium]
MTEPKDLLNDPAFLRGLTMRRMTRRDLFRSAGVGVGALSIGAILAACGGTSGGGSAGGGSGSTGGGGGIDWNAKPNGQVNFANWPLYIDKKRVNGKPTSLEQFTLDTNIQMTYREVINSNAGFFGKIQPQLAAGQSTGWDIIVITNGDILNQLFRLNYLIPLPTDKRPNFDANASVAVKSPSYDPGNKFTMAWQSGLTGVGWDPVQVKALRPSNPVITSVMDLFDPAFKGKVGMFGDNTDLPNLVLVGMGVDPATSTPTQWQAAADLLQKQKSDGVVRQYYDQSYTNALQSGDIAVTMAWSGDIFQLNLEGDASGLQFCIPSEGVIIWTDNMCIPVGAENPVDAITYMDYVYQPAIQAEIETYVNYICPVPTAADVIDPSFAKSPLIFPSADDLAKTHTYYVFKTPDEQNQWNSLFQAIYQG